MEQEKQKSFFKDATPETMLANWWEKLTPDEKLTVRGEMIGNRDPFSPPKEVKRNYLSKGGSYWTEEPIQGQTAMMSISDGNKEKWLYNPSFSRGNTTANTFSSTTPDADTIKKNIAPTPQPQNEETYVMPNQDKGKEILDNWNTRVIEETPEDPAQWGQWAIKNMNPAYAQMFNNLEPTSASSLINKMIDDNIGTVATNKDEFEALSMMKSVSPWLMMSRGETLKLLNNLKKQQLIGGSK